LKWWAVKGPACAHGLALAVALLAAACGDDAASLAAATAPDAATPYPNLRPRWGGGGHTLGYVSNGLSDTISVVDLDTMTAVGSAPVGRDPVDIDGPTGLTIDRDHGLVYVALAYPLDGTAGPHAAHNASPRAGYLQALALDDLRPLGELRLDPSPADVALSDDGSALVVSHADTARALAAGDDIDARRAALALIAPAPAVATGGASLRRVTTCVVPNAIALGAGGARAFVACTGEDALAVVDTASATVLARVPDGATGGGVSKPYALVADPARERLLLSNEVARTIVLFTMDDAPTPVFTTPLDGIPYFAAWLSASRILVPTQSPDGAVIVDAATGAVTAEAAYADTDCLAPREARVAPDGRVFLVCEGDHYAPGSIVRVDPTTLAVQATIAVGVFPNRLQVLAP
jgi:DNA-binding beta-propeller fold protein YncE